MSDSAKAYEGAKVEKYSPEQVEHSRKLLGREPTGAELGEHHDAPAHGIVHAGPDDDEARDISEENGG